MYQLRKEIIFKNKVLKNQTEQIQKAKNSKVSKKNQKNEQKSKFILSNIELDKLYDNMFNRTKIDAKTKESLHILLRQTIYNLIYEDLDRVY